jgi:GGDEF domain-containing protein
MLSGPPRRRRARPVADAPIDALLDRVEDLTKGWLLALLERAPLDDAPRILAADLTREGPRVCAAMLRAIADETDHRRLEPGGALAPLAARVGELAGASGAAATSLAVDALQAVVWSALRSELPDPDPDLITELAERLTQVTELMRAAALAQGEVAEGSAAPGPALAAVRAPEEPPPAAPAQPRPPAQPAPRTWGGARASSHAPEALWIEALAEEIERTGDAPLSLLLAELEDADRVLSVEDEAGAAGTFGEFARAVRGVVRRQDILVCETDSRAWIIARDTGRGGAHALGARIAAAVRAGEPWRGAPLTASVGVAVLGEDGRDPAELIDAAEEARYAAAARGVDVLQSVPEESPGT